MMLMRLVLIAALMVAPVFCSQPDQQPYTISDNVDIVMLDVAVKDSAGRYVSDLSKGNFRVFDDGEQRDITQFSKTDEPVTVGLVVDDSGSMRNKRPYVILAGLAFAKESNSKDQFFVVNFNNAIVPGLPADVPFSNKLQQIRAALYFGPAEGQTALYDAIAYSLQHAEQSHQEKRTLIVVSDGKDNVSKLKFPELLRVIASSRATIYTIGIYDQDDYDTNPEVLRKIADASGGEFFQPQTLEDVLPIFKKISEDVRNRYTLSYAPDEAHDKRKLRTIKVIAEENGRKLRVRARRSYAIVPYSQPLSEAEVMTH
jgi:VWFA-related protein